MVPIPDLMLAVQFVRRGIACLLALVGLALFEIRDQGTQPSIRRIKSGDTVNDTTGWAITKAR